MSNRPTAGRLVVKRRRWAVAAATLAAATSAAVAAWLALAPGFTPEPMPDPNGFDDVAEAAGMIEGQPPAFGELTGMTDGDLRHLVEAGRAALDRAPAASLSSLPRRRA